MTAHFGKQMLYPLSFASYDAKDEPVDVG